MPVAARHLAAVPGPATRKKVDSIIRVTLSRDFRVVWENSVGTDALVRPQRDSAAGKNSFGISIPASVGRDALVPPTINRTPLSLRAKRGNLVETKCCLLARASPLARGGSPSRNSPRKKREQAYTLCGGPRANRPTVGYAVNRTRLSLRAKRGNLVETKCRLLARAGSAPHQLTCLRWLTAEKSPAEETRTSENKRTRTTPNTRPRGLRAPRWLTAAKKRFARFYRENRFSIYVIAFLRRESLISVSCGYTYSAFTAACFRDRSRFLSLPKPFTSVPATEESRVVFYKTKKTG